MEKKVKKFNWLLNYINVNDMTEEMLLIYVKLNPENIKKIKLNIELVNKLFNENPEIINFLNSKWRKVLLPEIIVKYPEKIIYIPKNSNSFNRIYFLNKKLLSYLPKSQQNRINKLCNFKKDTIIDDKLFTELIKFY